MQIRLYSPETDRPACLAIFDSNSGSGREAFAAYLDATPAGPPPPGSFWVMDLGGGNVVACGGIDAVAGELCWGMVRKDVQRQGVGRFLLLYRLKELGKVPGLVTVRAVVPATYARFYEKNGMKLAGISGESAEFRMKLEVCSS